MLKVNDLKKVLKNTLKIYVRAEHDGDFELMLYRTSRRSRGFTNVRSEINASLVESARNEGLEPHSYIYKGKFYMRMPYIIMLLINDYVYHDNGTLEYKDGCIYVTI